MALKALCVFPPIMYSIGYMVNKESSNEAFDRCSIDVRIRNTQLYKDKIRE